VRNQGTEDSGWITDALLRAAAQAIPGLDVGTMIAARQTTEVDNALVATEQQASSARVNRTPTSLRRADRGDCGSSPGQVCTPLSGACSD
jgi:hypothetical protein